MQYIQVVMKVAAIFAEKMEVVVRWKCCLIYNELQSGAHLAGLKCSDV